jgi:kinetochore protein Mis13/DSN1
MFKRVKKKKPELKKILSVIEPDHPQSEASKSPSKDVPSASVGKQEPHHAPKRKRRKLSFSTPNAKQEVPVRRSKRLSRDNESQDITSSRTTTRNVAGPTPIRESPLKQKSSLRTAMTPGKAAVVSTRDARRLGDNALKQPAEAQFEETEKQHGPEAIPIQQEDHSATKIALPFADTPVIKRNKAMREGRSSKGERRSSLGFRGRRASSLIDTGNSNGTDNALGFMNTD